MSKMSQPPEPAAPAERSVHQEIEALISDAGDLAREIDGLGSSIEAAQREVAGHLARADEHLSQYRALLLDGETDRAAKELEQSKTERAKAVKAAEQAAGHRAAVARLAAAAAKLWGRFVDLAPRAEEQCQEAKRDRVRLGNWTDGISRLGSSVRNIDARLADLSGAAESQPTPARESIHVG